MADSAPIDHLLRPLRRLLSYNATVGVVLFFAALFALILANSSWGAEWYHHLWEQELALMYEGEEIFHLNLHHFINDGLMAIFFFMVGLEIKREFLGGELSQVKKAMLPIGAAVGGMVVPAVIYIALNPGDGFSGWGIPMATDIAFTLGLINLVGNRVPLSAKIFITSLAVVDDIGAVLVIAFFYTSDLDVHQLYVALGTLAFLFICNKLGVRSVLFYAFMGISGIWVAFFYSGIHPTIAGILLAFTIPSKTRINKDQFTDKLKVLYRKYLRVENEGEYLNSGAEEQLLSRIRSAGDDARTPLQKIETGLHGFVYFIIMPLFAFANAGVKLDGNILEVLGSSIGLGIIIGLIAGKLLGISLISRLLVWLKLAELPEGTNWKQIYGMAMMAGIGFTMSLFIGELAFKDEQMIESAKLATLVASSLAAIGGLLFLRFANPVIEEGHPGDPG